MKLKILTVLVIAGLAFAGCGPNRSETESTYGDTLSTGDSVMMDTMIDSPDTTMSSREMQSPGADSNSMPR